MYQMSTLAVAELMLSHAALDENFCPAASEVVQRAEAELLRRGTDGDALARYFYALRVFQKRLAA